MKEVEKDSGEGGENVGQRRATWKERNEGDGDGEFGDGARVKRRKETVAGRDRRGGTIERWL